VIYHPKRAGTKLTFVFKEKGLDFTRKDESIHKSEDILNKSHEFFEKNSGHMGRALYFLM
jgi:transposase-like protein